MVEVKTLSSRDFMPRDRTALWSKATSGIFSPQTVMPTAPGFHGNIAWMDLGLLRLVEVRSTAALVRHLGKSAWHHDDRCYLLRIQVAGRGVYRQEGQEILLEEGDFMLCDSQRDYEIEFPEAAALLVLRIPEPLLRMHIPALKFVTGVGVCGQAGFGGLVSRFIQDIWGSRSALPESTVDLSTAILTLIASAFEQVGTRTRPHALRSMARAIDYIEAHLGDSTLNPGAIAGGVGISVRYLHRLFEERGETLTKYVQRRRIERIRLALRDAAQARRSITDIALAHGFASASHFSTLFVRANGCTATAFRKGAGGWPPAHVKASAGR